MALDNKAIYHVIDPRAVYSLAAAREALGLKKETLPREARLGRLRVSKRAGRYYVLGTWLIQWLKGGEIRRPRAGGVAVGAAEHN